MGTLRVYWCLSFLAQHCSDSGREVCRQGGLAVQLASGVGAREWGLMNP